MTFNSERLQSLSAELHAERRGLSELTLKSSPLRCFLAQSSWLYPFSICTLTLLPALVVLVGAARACFSITTGGRGDSSSSKSEGLSSESGAESEKDGGAGTLLLLLDFTRC